jgi:hypothetical protein
MPVYAMKAYKGVGVLLHALSALTLVDISFTRTLYLKKRASWCPWNSRLSRQPHNLSIHLEEMKNLLPLPWLKP